MLSRSLPPTVLLAGLLALTAAAPAEPVPDTAASDLEAALEEARRLHRQGRLDEAHAAYSAIAEQAEDTDAAIAAIARNNACVVLTNRGRHREAVSDCRRALELRRGLGDDRRTARTLNNLGLALQYQGELDEAEVRFLEARDINRELGETGAEVINEANLGVLATLAGRYDQALGHHETAARIARGEPDAAWSASQLRTATVNRGVVLEKLGAYRDALDLYQEVLADEGAMEPWQMAPLLVNRGVIYRNLGDPVRALEDFARARELYRRSDDLSGLSNTWLNEALALHLNLGRLEEAEESYRRALALALEGGDRSEEIQDLFYLAALLREDGRLEEAEEAYARCLETSRAADSPEGRWSSLEGLGRVHHAQGRTDEALDDFMGALEEIERTRKRISPGRLRSGYLGDRRSAFDATVELLAELDLHHPGQGFAAAAYHVSQRAKARDLLDLLGPRGAPLAPLSVEQVRELLGEAVLLEYFVTPSSIFRWEIHARGSSLDRVDSGATVVDSVTELHGMLSRGDAPAESLLRELANELLGRLSGRGLATATLHIASEGRLRYLPFELLPDPANRAEPLLARAVLTYLPSGSVLGRASPERSPSRLVFAGLGNPALEVGRAGAPAAAAARRFGLGPLPAAERELRLAARALPGPSELALGARATEEAFREMASSGSRVFHLASHAVLDERSENGAAILLGPSVQEDGILFPEEISELTIPNRLTVLSACRSALGGPEDGRALASLTGAFLAAGSNAVLATLWEVGDDTAAVFTEQYYHELGRGQTPARALRTVKLRLRSNPAWSRPEIWAGWVLAGEGDLPVVGTPIASRVLLTLGVLGLLAAGFGAVSRLRRRARPS